MKETLRRRKKEIGRPCWQWVWSSRKLTKSLLSVIITIFRDDQCRWNKPLPKFNSHAPEFNSHEPFTFLKWLSFDRVMKCHIRYDSVNTDRSQTKIWPYINPAGLGLTRSDIFFEIKKISLNTLDFGFKDHCWLCLMYPSRFRKKNYRFWFLTHTRAGYLKMT